MHYALRSLFNILLAVSLVVAATPWAAAPAKAQAAPSAETSLRAVKVETGGNHTCAIIDDGSVYCWGQNWYGTIGNGDHQDWSANLWESEPVPAHGLKGIVDIAIGEQHTCALDAAGEVYCWGLNNAGQLGFQSETAYISTPRKVTGIPKASEVFSGGNHSCILSEQNELWCWGSNDDFSLGRSNGARGVHGPAVADVVADEQIRDVVLGGKTTCIITSAHKVKCWGFIPDGSWGYMENYRETLSIEPVEFHGLGEVEELTVGTTACARLSSGSVKCWGSNSFGELGNSGQSKIPLPVSAEQWEDAEMPQWEDSTQFTRISNIFCAITAESTVKCAGANSYLAAGGGEDDDYWIREPREVRGLSGVSQLSTSGQHTCAIVGEGEVYCWGSNQHGQLGIGSIGGPIERPYEGIGFPQKVYLHPPSHYEDTGDTCAAAYFVAVPGSGEQDVTTSNWQSKSRSLWFLRKSLDEALADRGIPARKVQTLIVDYPALDVKEIYNFEDAESGLSERDFKTKYTAGLDRYLSGKDEGVRELNDTLRGIDSACVDVPVLLAGYSQGAMVVHDWLNGTVIGGEKYYGANVVGAALIADPERVAFSSVENLGTARSRGQGVCLELSFVDCASGRPVVDVQEPSQTVQVCDLEDVVCDTSESLDRLWRTYKSITRPADYLSFVPVVGLGLKFSVIGASGGAISEALESQVEGMIMTHNMYGANNATRQAGKSLVDGLGS